MKRTLFVAGGALAAIVALCLLAIVVARVLLPVAEQERQATVVKIANKVDAHPRPQEDWRPAVANMTVYGGGRVRTGVASSAQLDLQEGTVRLSAETIFTVKESSTQRGTLLTTILLQEGRLWAKLTTNEPHVFTVQTSSAAAVVRDTHFTIRVVNGETLVSVADGEVELTAQKQTVVVSAGQQASVEPGKPPSWPQPMSDSERALWAIEGGEQELATPTPTRALTEVNPPTATPLPTTSPEPTATGGAMSPTTSIPEAAPTATVCIPPASWQPYTIQSGDTLSALALRCDTTVTAIMQANGLETTTIYQGCQIYLPLTPPPSAPTPVPAACVASPLPGWVPYAVQRGDTLYGLALSRGTTLLQLRQANCLASDSLYAGQRIYLPPAPIATPTLAVGLTPTPAGTTTPIPPVTPTPTWTLVAPSPTAATPTPTWTLVAPTPTPTWTPTTPAAPTPTATVPPPTPTATPTPGGGGS